MKNKFNAKLRQLSVNYDIIRRWTFLMERLETVAAHAQMSVAGTAEEEFFRAEVIPDIEKVKIHFELIANRLINSSLTQYPIPSHMLLQSTERN